MRFPIVTVLYIIIIVLATLLVGCRRADAGEIVIVARQAVVWSVSEDGTWLVAGDDTEEGEAKTGDSTADEHLMFGESLGELAVGI